MEEVREGPEEGTDVGHLVLFFCFMSVTLAWNVPSWQNDIGLRILKLKGPRSQLLTVQGRRKLHKACWCIFAWDVDL